MMTKFMIQLYMYDMQNMVDILWTPKSFRRILLPLPFNLIPKNRKTKLIKMKGHPKLTQWLHNMN